MRLQGKMGEKLQRVLIPLYVTHPHPDCSQELCSEPSVPARTEGRSLESRAPPKHPHKSPEGERFLYLFIQ